MPLTTVLGSFLSDTRARTLLEKNAVLRPNAESLDALARVERAVGEPSRADELARRAAAIRADARGDVHADNR